MAKKRSCTVRGLTDNSGFGTEYVRVFTHVCSDCCPEAWLVMEACGDPDERDDETVTVLNLRAAAARKLGKWLITAADEIDAERKAK